MSSKIIEEDIVRIWEEFSLKPIAGKTILLTGSTGLIGTYLIYSIIKFNKDNNNKIKLVLIAHNDLPKHLNFLEYDSCIEIYRGDLSDYVFCQSLPCADYIIHAAGYGQPGKFMSDKMKTILINTMATKMLLEKLNENGKFLFVSTSEVYSGSDKVPYSEDDYGTTMPDHFRACYIEGKRCGEAICHAFEERHNNSVKIARVSLSYGPGVRNSDKRVLYNFIQKGLDGKISMLDAGEAKRVYCYVSDTVSILWNILLRGEDIVYNVGGKSHTTIFELATLIAKVLQVPLEKPFQYASEIGAPKEVFVDMKKVEKEFNKTQYVSLEEGIGRTIAWYRSEVV